jgi:CheY-like chemotaxis protein
VNESVTSRGAGRGIPILIVEDDGRTRAAFRRALEGEGYQVSETADGKQALELLTSGQAPEPRVIVLDLGMPMMTGDELLAVLGNYHRLARIPVIITSGVIPSPPPGEPGQVVHFLEKPFTAAELLETVAAIAETFPAT